MEHRVEDSESFCDTFKTRRGVFNSSYIPGGGVTLAHGTPNAAHPCIFGGNPHPPLLHLPAPAPHAWTNGISFSLSATFVGSVALGALAPDSIPSPRCHGRWGARRACPLPFFQGKLNSVAAMVSVALTLVVHFSVNGRAVTASLALIPPIPILPAGRCSTSKVAQFPCV